jgi:uncharacterized protein
MAVEFREGGSMAADLHARYGGWAVVTGASSGIGECYAIALAKRGFPLVLTARREDRLTALASRLADEHGVETHVVPLDLGQPGACGRLVEGIGDRDVGLLVNNAGFGFSGRFLDIDREHYEAMVQLNCAVPVSLTHLLLPGLLERGRGAMIILASVAGYQPTPFFAVYGATKAFDLMLGEALWSELQGTGVDVLAVSPGETNTEFSSQAHFAREGGGMDAMKVVEASLGRLGRAPSYVPGIANKFSAFLHRLLPRGWVAHATGFVLAKELQRTTPRELRKRPWK